MPSLENKTKPADLSEINKKDCKYRSEDSTQQGKVMLCNHQQPNFCDYLGYRAWRGRPNTPICYYPQKMMGRVLD